MRSTVKYKMLGSLGKEESLGQCGPLSSLNPESSNKHL